MKTKDEPTATIRAEGGIRLRIAESVRVHQSLLLREDDIRTWAEIWTDSIRGGGHIYLFGNGGSAADAQHWACELSGRFYLDRKPLPATALTVNTSALTAIANDYSYDEVFSRQLEAVARAGDVAVGISTSGNSGSVVRALESARRGGLVAMALTGRGGGAAKTAAEHWIGIDSDDTPRVQEGHELIGHLICEWVERALFDEPAPQEG